MSFTCPYSRCRTPFRTYRELDHHLKENWLTGQATHRESDMGQSGLVDEVTALVTSNLRLQQTCDYLQNAVQSYIRAEEDRRAEAG